MYLGIFGGLFYDRFGVRATVLIGGTVTAVGYLLIFLCTSGAIPLPRTPEFDPAEAYAKGALVATNNTCFKAKLQVPRGGGGGSGSNSSAFPHVPSADWEASECSSSSTAIYAVLFAVAWQGSGWLDSSAMATNIKNFQRTPLPLQHAVLCSMFTRPSTTRLLQVLPPPSSIHCLTAVLVRWVSTNHPLSRLTLLKNTCIFLASVSNTCVVN